MHFVPGIVSLSRGSSPTYWFAFRNTELLVKKIGDTASIPHVVDLSELSLEPIRTQFLGTLDGFPCCSVELADDAVAPEGMVFSELRSLFEVLGKEFFQLAGRAVQIMNWDRTHLFCGRCGASVEAKGDEHAKMCSQCSLMSFPRISPAIIVAVVKDDHILLARANRYPIGFFSVLAGFVEPGETLEECVRREVREETGLKVKNIWYFGSQPWPFPHSLMIGFVAEYASGTITIDGTEIAEAKWFTARDLPHIPQKVSIARQLIDWFIEKSTRGSH